MKLGVNYEQGVVIDRVILPLTYSPKENFTDKQWFIVKEFC